MKTFLIYSFLGLLAVCTLWVLFAWLSFRTWQRENSRHLSRRHWMTDGDFPDCDERTGEPLTEEEMR